MGRSSRRYEATRPLARPSPLSKPRRRTPKPAALSPLRLLLAKVFADSILFQAPLLNLYFATMGALEGLSPSEIYARAKEKFHRAWALSIVVWSPVQFLNFCYVPPPLQPVPPFVQKGVELQQTLRQHDSCRSSWAATIVRRRHNDTHGMQPPSAPQAAVPGP